MKTQITLVGLENIPGLVVRVRGNGKIEIDASSVPLHAGETYDPSKNVQGCSANGGIGAAPIQHSSRTIR